MIFKNIFRIIRSYRFSLIKIIFFEFIYLIKGYKGNSFNFSPNDIMTDNIPCPYYFLYRIKRALKDIGFTTFIDLGCGSGRVINFFNSCYPKNKFIGIEYFEEQFLLCKKNLDKYKNIQLLNSDFRNVDVVRYNADCYFFNEPIKDDLIFTDYVKKIIDINKQQKTLLIFVNCNKAILESIKDIQCVETYYINDRKGYSIYYASNKN